MTSAVATSSQPVAGSASSAVKQEEIILQYKAMRAELQRMAQKVGDLEGEKEEHRLVLETMEPLEADRKCFRLINGVLVERKVGQVVPQLKENMLNLGTVIENLLKAYKQKESDLAEYQQKHQIRVEARSG